MERRKFTVKRRLPSVITKVIGRYLKKGAEYWRCDIRTDDGSSLSTSIPTEKAKQVIQDQIRKGHDLPEMYIQDIAPVDRSIRRANQDLTIEILQ